MQKTTPLKSGVALFCGVWFDAYFWNEYNKPWLDNVISRDDIIKIATEPTWDNLTRVNVITGKTELTGFGREYTYLMQHGYKYDPITKTMNRQG